MRGPTSIGIYERAMNIDETPSRKCMKILVAGPGTGKTTNIKSIIASDFSGAKRIKVLSFTNFTVNDLTESFQGNECVNCSTLHGYAFGLNHQKELYVATGVEEKILQKLSDKTDISLANVCTQLACITFDGMIAASAAFIAANEVYAKEKIGDLDLLLVDEFQDFNPSEQELVSAVSHYATETIILGDDDQSIYGFKDADPDGIISVYNNDKVEKIPHQNVCYRCPDEVVDLGIKLLAANKRRIQKEWKKNGNPGSVNIRQFKTNAEEDDYVLSKIEEIRKAEPEASILILSPLRLVVDGLREKFGEDNPAVVDCWVRQDEELQKRIWWLCAIFLKDNLKFIIFLLGTRRLARNKKIVAVLKDYLEKGGPPQDDVEALLKLKPFSEPFAIYLRKAPEIEQFFADHPEYEEFREHIDMERLDKTLKGLQQKFRSDVQFEKEKINLMSIHKSKGLQAEYVFILGLTSGILPNDERGLDTIEAQRRLLFVGMTRALKELFLLSTLDWKGADLKQNNADMSQFNFRFITKDYRGRSSRFIEEMKT